MTEIPEANAYGDHAQGLAEYFKRRATRGPERPALTFQDQHWTYGQLQSRIVEMAAMLAAGGVRRGDRVAYLGLNHPVFFFALFATARLGAIFVPLNFRLTGAELEFIVNDAGVHTLIASDDFAPLIDSIRDSLCCQRYLRVGTAAAGWESCEPTQAAGVTDAPIADNDPNDAAVIMYTSGTTGRPKGAVLTHRNFWTNNLNCLLTTQFNDTDVGIVCAPLFHVGGLCIVPLPLFLAGGHVVLHSGFDAATFLADVARLRVSVGFAVPAMLLFVSQHPQFSGADLSSLRMIMTGGAPVPEALLRLYNGRGIPVHQGYGLTETTAMTCFLDPKDAARIGSCGSAPILTEYRIKDLDGKIVDEAHARGEVQVRGGNVMRGYWNRPEATAAAFDGDGWFRTGDIGYVDEAGFLYICDRVKDMVISGGENIYPAEVEGVLYEHPAIAEVAVIGNNDERWGERVVAVAVLKPGAQLTLEELQAFAGARLARYKLPKELRLMDALPRNPAGKVLKAMLRERNTAC